MRRRSVGIDLPLGEGGERVHHWMFQRKSAAEAEASSSTESRPSSPADQRRKGRFPAATSRAM